MDKLFEELFDAISAFTNLWRKVPTRISEYGIKHNLPKKEALQNWNALADELDFDKDAIRKYVLQGIDSNRYEINTNLDSFRYLSKRLDNINFYWSTYYNDIDKTLDDIHCLLIDIDRKYKLGQHKKN